MSEHSFSKTLAAGRPDAKDLASMQEFGAKIAEKLTSGWEYTAPAYVKGCDPIRPYFKPQDRHGAHIDMSRGGKIF